MATLELIEENSSTCPAEFTVGKNLPLLLVGAVGVIAIVGMMYAGGKSTSEV